MKMQKLKMEESFSLHRTVSALAQQRLIREEGAVNVPTTPVKASTDKSHVALLTRLYKDLAERLSAFEIAAEMFQNQGLTMRELARIQGQRGSPGDAAETLLRILIEQPSEVYRCFLDALKASKRDDIYNWLVSEGYDGEHIMKLDEARLSNQINALLSTNIKAIA